MNELEVLAGAITGLLVGLTGVGGGALMTPLLLLFFATSPLVAVGTDLWFAAITKLFATNIHYGHGLIDWQVVKRLWTGSLTASTLTLIWMHFYPIEHSSVELLNIIIALAVIITAIGLVFQRNLHALGRHLRLTDGQQFKMIQAPLTMFAGVVLGILVTLTSVGSGALGVVFLSYLYPLRLTASRLIATDIVHAIPLAMFAGIGHLFIGNVDFRLLANLLLGSIPMVIIGAMLSARLPQGLLRNLLALVLLIIGIKVMADVVFAPERFGLPVNGIASRFIT